MSTPVYYKLGKGSNFFDGTQDKREKRKTRTNRG